jgi:hypothetical protein
LGLCQAIVGLSIINDIRHLRAFHSLEINLCRNEVALNPILGLNMVIAKSPVKK